MKINMVAPCGINCSVCLKQFKLPVACDGCNSTSRNKPKYCYNCIIRNCEKRLSNNYKYCFQCDTYPCRRLMQLDNRYRTSYDISLLENLKHIKENGIRTHIKNERIKWACPKCGQLLSVHRKNCLRCETKIKKKASNMPIESLQTELKHLANKAYAARLQKYFKTGKGEYGEGDIFLGIRVPALRKIAGKYRNIPIDNAAKLLKSPFHEERLISLFMMVGLFTRNGDKDKQKIYTLYLKNTKFINNWDLVDASAGHIAGAYLLTRDKKPLYALSKSKNIWKRRISIMATSHFIWNHKYSDAFKISKILLNDKEDLIHKAVGWMLREIGNRDLDLEENFLKKYYQTMPRTMLRYAIEKFPEKKRMKYLKGNWGRTRQI